MEENFSSFYKQLVLFGFNSGMINQLIKLYNIGYDLSFISTGESVDTLRDFYHNLTNDLYEKNMENFINDSIENHWDFLSYTKLEYNYKPCIRYIHKALNNGLDATTLNDPRFTEEQCKIILDGIREKVDTTVYSNYQISAEMMNVMLTGLIKDINLKSYYKDGFDKSQLLSILHVLEHKKNYPEYDYDINLIIKHEYDGERIALLHTALVNNQDISLYLDNNFTNEQVHLLRDAQSNGCNISLIANINFDYDKMVGLVESYFLLKKTYDDIFINDFFSEMIGNHYNGPQILFLTQQFIDKKDLSIYKVQDTFADMLQIKYFLDSGYQNKLDINTFAKLSIEDKIIITRLLDKSLKLDTLNFTKPLYPQYKSILFPKREDFIPITDDLLNKALPEEVDKSNIYETTFYKLDNGDILEIGLDDDIWYENDFFRTADEIEDLYEEYFEEHEDEIFNILSSVLYFQYNEKEQTFIVKHLDRTINTLEKDRLVDINFLEFVSENDILDWNIFDDYHAEYNDYIIDELKSHWGMGSYFLNIENIEEYGGINFSNEYIYDMIPGDYYNMVLYTTLADIKQAYKNYNYDNVLNTCRELCQESQFRKDVYNGDIYYMKIFQIDNDDWKETDACGGLTGDVFEEIKYLTGHEVISTIGTFADIDTCLANMNRTIDEIER